MINQRIVSFFIFFLVINSFKSNSQNYASLDGVDDYIEIYGGNNGILNGVNEGIIETKIRYHASAQNQSDQRGNIFIYGSETGNSGLELRITEEDNGLKFAWGFYSEGITKEIFSGEIVKDKWYKVTAVWGENLMKLFVDDSLVSSSTTINPNLENLSSIIRLGTLVAPTYTKIDFDYLKIYSGNKIDPSHNYGDSNTILGYYEFAENDQMKDLSSNGNNGAYFGVNSFGVIDSDGDGISDSEDLCYLIPNGMIGHSLIQGKHHKTTDGGETWTKTNDDYTFVNISFKNRNFSILLGLFIKK